MKLKEFIKSTLASYFIIVTLVNVATLVLGSIFRPEQRFGYEAFLAPLLYGALGLIPVFIMYSPKELTIKQIVIRKIVQLIALEFILVLAGFGRENLKAENLALIASFALSVLIIYVLVHVISWVLNLEMARQLTMDLQSYQSRELRREKD
ncbi:MAG: hypothetical protein KIH00_00300 [Lachnospiraceae bacterium]|nr:hypothetical protein [Lachnospiraceae bacterium]